MDVFFPVLKFESLTQREAYLLENFFSKYHFLMLRHDFERAVPMLLYIGMLIRGESIIVRLAGIWLGLAMAKMGKTGVIFSK